MTRHRTMTKTRYTATYWFNIHAILPVWCFNYNICRRWFEVVGYVNVPYGSCHTRERLLFSVTIITRRHFTVH